MPEEMSLIDKQIRADPLVLTEILERVPGQEAVAVNLEFLAVAGRVQRAGIPAIEIGQVHPVHGLDHDIVGGADILEGETPVDRIFKSVFRHAR